MASVLVDLGNGTLRLYNKGASEWVLDISTHVLETDGSRVPLTEQKKSELLAIVTAMASRGLRTLVCFLVTFANDFPRGGPGRALLASCSLHLQCTIAMLTWRVMAGYLWISPWS